MPLHFPGLFPAVVWLEVDKFLASHKNSQKNPFDSGYGWMSLSLSLVLYNAS